MELYYPEIHFKPKNKNEPMQIYYTTHFYNFNQFNTKVERFYLKEFTLIDDNGWVFESKTNSSLWGYDRMDTDAYSKNLNNYEKDFITDFSSSKIYSFVIYVNRNKKVFTRKYDKLFDTLGNIISLVNGIFTLFRYISQFFTEASQDRDIVNNVFLKKNDM